MPTLGSKRVAARANAGLATKVRRLERSVQQNKAEKKFITGTIPWSDIATGNYELTQLITAGVGKDERVGDTINIKAVEVRTIVDDGNTRKRLTLYTPVDAGNVIAVNSGGTGYLTEWFDTDQFKIWSDNLSMDRLDDTDGATLYPGKILSNRKSFSIPMKVKYRPGAAEAYNNPVVVRYVQQGLRGGSDIVGVPGTEDPLNALAFKIWYFDG